MRTLAVVAAAASVLLLSGCASPVAIPEEPTAYEVLAVSRAQLDATWELTGLDGVIDRPEYRVGVASESQLRYLWDYYTRWVIPCIVDQRYALNRLPTREQFLATGTFQWTPYGALTDILGDTEYAALVARCGPEYGVISR